MPLVIAITTEQNSDPRGERPFKTGHAFHYLMATYPAMLRRGGAIPLLLPCGGAPEEASHLVRQVDGLLLSGGADLDPALWGEAELEPGGHVVPIGEDERARSRWEDSLVRAALAAGLPLLGICRGMQQLNVSLGGSLWQDLERQAGRPGHPGGDNPYDLVHSLDARPAADGLAGLMVETRVTSSHHQGLRRLGEGLEVLATARGEPEVVEAVRHRGHPFLMGVQWHPERMAGSALTLGLTELFLQAARRRRASS
jgi:putative glutamine amidotransferase